MLELLFSKILFLFLRASSSSSFPPPLSAKEEKELFFKCSEGDKKAREKLGYVKSDETVFMKNE